MPESFDWRSEIRTRLRGANIDPACEAEIVDELAQHLEDQTIDLVAHGRTAAAARGELLAMLDDPASKFPHDLLERRRARRTRDSAPLGARPTVKGFAASVWHDLEYGARGLARTPGFTLIVVLSLGVVIGANTAIFGLFDSVFLRRLPIPHPEQFVAIRPINDGHRADLRYNDYKTIKQTFGLTNVEAYAQQGATVSAQGDRTDMWVELVTGGYFDLIGVPPLLGRALSRSDEANSSPVAVVSEDYWRQHLGADRAALGKPITINEVPFTLIGVMPHSFGGIFFAHRSAVAIPLTAAALYDDHALSNWSVAVIGRMERGANDKAAAARISTAFLTCCRMGSPESFDGSARASAQPHVMPPDAPTSASGGWQDTLNKTPHVTVLDASRGITWSVDFRDQYQRVLAMLMVGVLLLLLVACANVGTLMLARAAARQREFAVRMSLGASRVRMLRQLLTESLEIAIAGSLLGLFLSWLGTTVLLHKLPGNALQLGDIIAWRVSPAILGFTLLITLACTITAGVWPARRASRTDILASLTGADRAVARSSGWPVDTGLATAQIALALVLVTAATLFVATIRNLQRADGGYHSRNILLARVDKDSIGRDAQTIIDDLRRLRGVDAVGASYAAPVINDFFFFVSVEVPGRAPLMTGDNQPEANAVTAGYFSATGIGMTAGREFAASDDADAEPVAIISETFAKRYFPNKDPIGQSIIAQIHTRHALRIVGIAHDALYKDLHGTPSAMWYVPIAQWNAVARPFSTIVVALRTSVDPVSLAPLVRRTIDADAKGANIRRLSAVGQLLDDALAKERFAAALASLFGAVALGLAALGVYGVIAYNVMRRIPEIGIRLALGATPRDALALVMRQAVTIAVAGIAIGLPLSYVASRAVASQLFGVSAGDPRVMIGAALVLAAVGLAAGAIPGRRATTVDAVVALRAE